MSSFTVSSKRKISTWLDEYGIELSHPRLENESLFDYKNRLLDIIKNPANATTIGLNNSFGRALKTRRSHALTIDVVSATEPYVEVTSKYLRLIDNGTIDKEIVLSEYTISEVITEINTSTKFSCTYEDPDLSNYSASKLHYGNNIFNDSQAITEYGYKLLNNTYINKYLVSSSKLTNEVDSLVDVVDINDFYVDKQVGAIYFSENGKGSISYSYFKIPYKIYYMPIRFYPLIDEDADEILYDQKYDTEEFSILNSRGSKIINTILKESPMTWGA